MNVEIANAMYGYLETLYVMNKKLLKLCGTDAIDDLENNLKIVLDIIQDIPRLVPYSYNNKRKVLEYDDRNGLLEFKDDMKYLSDEYDKILKENYEFLDKVRKIRNKYEHKMHGVKHKSSGSGSLSLFDFSFEVCGQNIEVTAGEFIKLIKSLNILFSKIVQDISSYAYENKKTDYPYYRKITRFNFADFNDLYDSDLIRKIGKAMNAF
ncbi:MAG: hypothetical protein Q4D02_04280 [Clostridia bacterium]|nr:hypothetical protein [Clostridia bacterium]